MSVFFRGFLGNFSAWSFAEEGSTPDRILAADPFHSASIFFRSLLNPFFLLGLIVLYIPFYLGRKDLPVYSRAERLLFGVCALLLTWEMVTYDYNYYLGHAFWIDRIVLVALCVALFRYPALTPLFVAFALVYRAQFNFPVAGFPMYDKRILFDLLILFCVHQYVRMLFRDFVFNAVYFALCILASYYFFSGLNKVFHSPHGYEWLTKNDPADLFNNVVIRGWLACSDYATVDTLRAVIMKYGAIFQTIVFILEIGVLLIFWKRRIAIWWLAALFFMHLGILVFGSILFWKWMAVDVVLLLILVLRRKQMDELYSNRRTIWLAVVIVCLSKLWLNPVAIAWHDTPFTQNYIYEVCDENGVWHPMDKNTMNPYHQWFQYDQFAFLVNEKLPDVSGFGYTSDYSLAEMLRQPAFHYDSVVAKKGKLQFNPEMKAGYEEFIRTYFRNRNRRVDQEFLITALAPPHHLYTGVCGDAYTGNFRVTGFRVTLKQVTSVGGRSMAIRTEVLDEISIPE